MSIEHPSPTVKRKRTRRTSKQKLADRIARAGHPRKLDLTKLTEQIERRDRIIKGAGLASYDDYLRSEYHQRIRAYVLERDQRTCQACGRPAQAVHHLTYTHETLLTRPRNRRNSLVNARLAKVVAVCHACHERIHFDRGRWKHDLCQDSVAIIQGSSLRRGSGSPTTATPRVRRRLP